MNEDNTTGKIPHDIKGKLIEITYTRYYLSDCVERVRLSYKGREVLLQSNRPEIINTRKRKSPKWQIISTPNLQVLKNPKFYADVFKLLTRELNKVDYEKKHRIE